MDYKMDCKVVLKIVLNESIKNFQGMNPSEIRWWGLENLEVVYFLGAELF